MDVPLRATLPLFGVGGLTLILSVIFCCYLWWLRRQSHGELGYKELPQNTIVVRYKKLKNKSSNEVCPVCLDEFRSGEKIAQCPCKHVFHCKCLLQWLQESNTCPMCKQQVKSEPSENTRLMRQENAAALMQQQEQMPPSPQQQNQQQPQSQLWQQQLQPNSQPQSQQASPQLNPPLQQQAPLSQQQAPQSQQQTQRLQENPQLQHSQQQEHLQRSQHQPHRNRLLHQLLAQNRQLQSQLQQPTLQQPTQSVSQQPDTAEV